VARGQGGTRKTGDDGGLEGYKATVIAGPRAEPKSMPKIKLPLAPPGRVALYDKLLAAARPAVESQGAGTPYTSLGGHMYSFLSPNGVVALRLPAGAREDFLREFSAALFIGPHGKPMAEFVAVPDGLLEDTAALGPWLSRSRTHVAGQKPKPTTRRKAG
jgi:hypothetical protein